MLMMFGQFKYDYLEFGKGSHVEKNPNEGKIIRWLLRWIESGISQ